MAFYWLLPVIAALMWSVMLITMMGDWAARGQPHFVSMSEAQTIPYLSDIGANRLKPLFVAGSCTTVTLLNASLFVERYFRSNGRLLSCTTRAQRILFDIAIAFSVIGSFGLVMLTIFDAKQRVLPHGVFLSVFVSGYLMAAIFLILHSQRLYKAYKDHQIFAISLGLKSAFGILCGSLATAYLILLNKGHPNPTAIVQWTVALSFALFIASLAVNLIPITSKSSDRASLHSTSTTEMERKVATAGHSPV